MPGPVPSSKRQPNRGLAKAQRILPAEGRTDPAPKWPLAGRAPKPWSELWAMPQAVAWESLHLERVVARYCQKLVLSEKIDASGAMCAEVRQLEDRLGLSAMSMLRLRWAIADMTEQETPASVTDMADYRTAFSG